MAKEVRRNDLCPCGSGEKYKNCCLKKVQPAGKISWTTYPEKFVIGELIRSSKEFRGFYEAERKKIIKPIYWAEDLRLPRGIDFRTTRLKNDDQEIQIIRLRRVPCTIKDSMNIAHELQHIILDIEGFITTGVMDRRFESVSSSLNSMLHDPIVNSRLRNYGFDLLNNYLEEEKESIRQLKTIPAPPYDNLSRSHWIFNYAGKILEWEVGSYQTGKNDNKFRRMFDEKYPDISEEGRKLVALIKEVDYDTPEKQAVLFKKIITMYNLDHIVFLPLS